MINDLNEDDLDTLATNDLSNKAIMKVVKREVLSFHADIDT
jgi:hypothetical protein